MLLAFETVARSASACLLADHGADHGTLLAEADLAGGEAEAGLPSLLDALLRAHGRPQALAVAAGPGSFTGLRIAAVAARTLAWLEDLPVWPVDSLAARACQQGDGVWWTLLPLTRDAAFHGLFRVAGERIDTLIATTLVAAEPGIEHPAPAPDHLAAIRAAGAVAIGPALVTRPGLAASWCPGIALGDAAPLKARGVARAARAQAAAGAAPVRWDAVLPAYHRDPAPVLQRERARRAQAG
jgi:tRNA threonylcarbamoyladenosine biosynthesis protein TsaB